MSGAVLELWSPEGGHLLINKDYNNLYLVRKVTLSVSAIDRPTDMSDRSKYLATAGVYVRQRAQSIIAVRSSNRASLGILRGKGDDVYILSEIATVVTVYEFAVMTSVDPNSLFQLYRENGSVAFDATAKPMRVISAVEFNLASADGVGDNVLIGTEPTNKLYAYAPTAIGARYIFQHFSQPQPVGAELHFAFCTGVGYENNDVRGYQFTIYSFRTTRVSGANYNFGQSNCKGFLIDVTNY